MPNFKKSKGFQLKSGNTTPFKSMGASPIKKTGIWQVDEEGVPVRITEEEAQIAESQGASGMATAGDKESHPGWKNRRPGHIIRDLSHGEEAVRDLYAKAMEMQGGEDITQEEVDAKIAEQQDPMKGKLWTSRSGYTRTEGPGEQYARDAARQASLERNVAAGRDPRDENPDYTGELPYKKRYK